MVNVRFGLVLSLRGIVPLAILVVGGFLLPPLARSEQLPEPANLVARIGTQPAIVTVYEPHLTTDAGPVEMNYVGYPFKQVADVILGDGWEARADALEFRTLDGYVSRIPVATFAEHSPYLVFKKADSSHFTVDNLPQNERNVPLGPYYLVWKNIFDEEILAEGLGIWPYQVTEIRLDKGSDAALLPTGIQEKFKLGAELAKAYCLNCHQVNGYGGEKIAGNLAEMARTLSAEKFKTWLLAPTSVKSDTKMPALAPSLPQEERLKIAADLYAYLVNLPLQE